MTEPVIVVLSPGGMEVARRIKQACGGEIHGFAKRVDDADVAFT